MNNGCHRRAHHHRLPQHWLKSRSRLSVLTFVATSFYINCERPNSNGKAEQNRESTNSCPGLPRCYRHVSTLVSGDSVAGAAKEGEASRPLKLIYPGFFGDLFYWRPLVAIGGTSRCNVIGQQTYPLTGQRVPLRNQASIRGARLPISSEYVPR